MKPQAFKKLDAGPVANKLQENVALKFNQLDSVPFISGTLLSVAGETTINLTGNTEFTHGLGQTPTGFLVLNKFANEDIWCTSLSSTTIGLQSSGSVDAIIWVF